MGWPVRANPVVHNRYRETGPEISPSTGQADMHLAWGDIWTINFWNQSILLVEKLIYHDLCNQSTAYRYKILTNQGEKKNTDGDGN